MPADDARERDLIEADKSDAGARWDANFRVSAGPYYRLAGGQRVPMAARGVMTFLAAHRRGQRVVIEARDSGGATVLLHTAGRRRSPVPGLVPRPYRIARIGRRLKA